MLEPASPTKIGTKPIPPKTPEKVGPLGEKLLKGKSLQKSASLKGQLNFDQFLSGPKPPASDAQDRPSGGRSPSVSLEKPMNAHNIIEAITFLEQGNHILRQSRYINCLRAPMADERVQKFSTKRQRALNLLANLEKGPRLESSCFEQAKHLAEECLKNLTEPQYFEPPENIAPIINFYIQTHPQIDYAALQETLDYLETCYDGGLERFHNYSDLKRKLAEPH